MNHTFGYILCCQSPALFLLAIALMIRFFICKSRAKFRAVLSLIGGLVCIALGVVLYYQGLVREHFAVRDFWHIRIPGWIGLALMAALLIYLSLRAFLRFSARRSEQKEAIRAENARRQEMEKAKADADRMTFLLCSALTTPKGVQSAAARQMTADILQELFPLG